MQLNKLVKHQQTLVSAEIQRLDMERQAAGLVFSRSFLNEAEAMKDGFFDPSEKAIEELRHVKVLQEVALKLKHLVSKRRTSQMLGKLLFILLSRVSSFL